MLRSRPSATPAQLELQARLRRHVDELANRIGARNTAHAASWIATPLLTVNELVSAPTGELPGALKISSVRFGSTAATETVTILVRDASTLARHALEWRPLPTAAEPDPAWNTYYDFSVGARTTSIS